ncbi:uncharacterized protein [Euwallacea fornicatus]|uniref:uncharacterized protein n=1 Tax=Euwallacea fornicatus TaxID=995702 RepID=UPI00338E3B5E
MAFSNEEAYDMLAVYFQCYENVAIAAREYSVKYPLRKHHSRKVFKRLANRLKFTGNVHPTRPITQKRRTRNQQNIVNILSYINYDPKRSTRGVARELSVPKTIIHEVLKEHKLHPYHIVLHQLLNDKDFDDRLNFCHWLENMICDETDFLSRVLWSDEATFKSNGQLNLHNSHYWSEKNPRWMREVDHQYRWTLNVWCGIVEGKIIGPYFFEQPLNGERYMEFLSDFLPTLLDNVTLRTRQTMWLQHDGCPVHYHRHVRRFLDEKFPFRWIGRGSIFPWPPRSPDLTCLDFYFWGRIKDLVYKESPTTKNNMKVRIKNAILSLSKHEIERCVNSTLPRIRRCIERDGKHFEHL